MAEAVTRGLRTAAKTAVLPEDEPEEVILTESEPPEPVEPRNAPKKDAYTPEEVESFVDEEEKRILEVERELGINEYLLTLSSARRRALQNPEEADRQEGMSASELAQVDLPTTIKGVAPFHARRLGMSTEFFLKRADDEGYSIDHFEDVIGRQGYTIQEAKARAPAFMEPEERRRQLRGQFIANIAEHGVPNPDPSNITIEDVLPTNREIYISDEVAGFYGSGDGLVQRDPLEEVVKSGEKGYKVATKLIGDLFKNRELAEMVPIWGQREQGWYDYALYKVKRATKNRPDLSGQELAEFKQKLLTRAIQEIALYKTAGLWTAPVFVPYEITDDGDVRIPPPDEMSWQQALKTNIEIIGMTEDRRTGDLRAVARQTGALQYAFDMADLLQSGIVGAIERKGNEGRWDAAVRGIATRRNFVEYALETKLAEEHPWVAMGLGFIPAMLTPDLFSGLAWAAKAPQKGVDYAKYARLAGKVSPELKLIAENRALFAAHMRTALDAEKAGDTATATRFFDAAATADRLASNAEVKVFNEFEPTMRRLDERDARVGERFSQINPNIGVEQAREVGKKLPGTDLQDEFFAAHASVRKVLLSVMRGAALEPQTLRNLLYSMFSLDGRTGAVDRLRAARKTLSEPDAWKKYASQEAHRAIGNKALLEIDGLDGGNARRLNELLQDGGTIDGVTFLPLSKMMELSDADFTAQFQSLLQKTVDTAVAPKVMKKFGRPLLKQMKKARKAWTKGDRVKEARKAIDDTLEALAVNSEARSVAAAIEYKEVMSRIFKKGDDFTPGLKEQLKKAYAVLELSERAIKFADQLARNFTVTDKFAQRVAKLLDARAETYAAKTGHKPHKWWDTHIGGVQSVAGSSNYIFKTPKASRNIKINRINQRLADAGKTIRIDWVGYNSKGQHLFQHVDTATNKPTRGSLPATGERDWDGLSASFSATPQGWGVVSESSGQPRGAFGTARASYGPSPETIEEGLKSRFRQVDEHPAPPSETRPDIQAMPSETYLVGDADDVVAWLLENTQSEINKTILEHIRSNVDAMFVIRNMAAEAPGQKLWQGVMRPRAAVRDRDVIEVTGRGFVFTGLSEETIIHELLHNATHERLADAFEVWVKQATDPLTPVSPAQLRDVKLFNSFLDVHDAAIPALRKAAEDGIEFPEFMIRPSVRQAPTDPEELQQWKKTQRTSISEMIAYGFTNPAYQDVLKSVRIEKESLWTRFTRRLAQLFNLSESDEFIDGLSRVIGLTEELLDAGVVRLIPDTEPQFMAVPKRDRLLGGRAAAKAPRGAARAWRRQEAASELGLYSKLEDSAREELPRSVSATDRVMTRKAQPAQPAGPVIDPKTGQPRVNRKTGEVIMKGARPAQAAKYKPGESVKVKVLSALGITPNVRRWELREGGKVVGTAASQELLSESAAKRLSRAVATRLAKREQDLAELQADRELAEMPGFVRNRQHIDEAKARIDEAEADIAFLRRMQRSMGLEFSGAQRTQKMLVGPRSKREVLKGLPTLVDAGPSYIFAKGIKAEEFELSNLDEFLDDLVAQGRTKVTRDEILEHLRTGRTVVTELQLGRTQPKALKALEARDEAFSKLHEAVQAGRVGPSSQLESQPDWWHRLSQDPYLVEKETLQWTEPEVIDVLSGVRGDVGTRGWVDFIHRGFPHPHNQYGRWVKNRITLDPFSGRAKAYEAPLKRDYARARHAAQQAAVKLNEILNQAGTRFEHVFREYTHGDQTAAEYLASVRAGYPHAEVVSAVRSFAERIKTLRELLEALGDDVVRGGGDLFTGGRSERRLENWLEGRIVDDPDPDIDFLRRVNTSGSIPRGLTKQYRDSWARVEAAYPDFPKWENRYYEALDQAAFGRWQSYKVSDPQDAAVSLWRLALADFDDQGADGLASFREFIGQIPAAYVPRTAAQKEALREIGDLWRSQAGDRLRQLAPGVTPVGAQPSRGQLALQAASDVRARLHELKLKAGILHRAPREYAIQDEFLNAIGYNPRRLGFEDPADPNWEIAFFGMTLDRKLASGAEGLEFIAKLRQLPEWVSWEKAFLDAKKLGGGAPLAPKWGSWRLAGGDNYSNFLIRLDSPVEDSDVQTVASRLNSAAQAGQGLADLSPGDLAAWERLHKKYPPMWGVIDAKTEKVLKRLDSKEAAEAYALAHVGSIRTGVAMGAVVVKPAGVLPPGSSIEETSTHLNDWIGRLSDSQFKPKHGSHWAQHNVVVHARTTDRLGFTPIDNWWDDLHSSQLAEELSQRYPSQWAQVLSGYANNWDLERRMGRFSEVTRARQQPSIAERSAAQEMRGQLDDELKVIQEARKRAPMRGAAGPSDYLKKQSRLELLDADLARPRKILFVEEIQSDWHQGGRARGYSASEHAALSIKARKDFQDIEAKITELRLARTKASEALDSLRVELGLHTPYSGYRPSSAERVKEAATLSPEAASQLERLNLEQARRGALLVEAEEKRKALHKLLQQTLPKGPVPEAPFKSTDSWLPLALKRLFKVAAEGGYEGIAFTRPELAAEYVQMPAKAAEKYYGQIVPSVASKHAGVPYSATYAVQEGDDLLEIARQQYGDARQIEIILEANRKKLGPDRVDDLLLTLDSENKFIYGRDFELKPGTKLTIPGAHAQKIDIPEAGVNALTNNNTYIDVDPRVGGKVPYIELTPEVRATIMEPQPQFMATPGAPPRPPPLTGQRALTEFLDDGRAVIRVFENADKSKDASVIIRQVGQILRRDLDSSDFASIVNWLRSHRSNKFTQLKAGVNKFEGAPEQIIDEAEDVFAEAFENYVRFNVAPSPELKAPFKELKQGIIKTWEKVRPDYYEQLSRAARSQLDAMLAESIPSQPLLPTAIEAVKRSILGSKAVREVTVFDTIAEEARRLGISSKSGDDWLEAFKASGEKEIRLPKPMKSQLFHWDHEVEVITADMLMSLQKNLGDEVVAVAGSQTPRTPLGAITDSVEEMSTTEALRQITHGEKWRHVFGRAAVFTMFGGDAYSDLRKFPPIMRMNVMAAVRPIQEAIGAAVRLGLEGDVTQLGKFLGGVTLSYKEGRPVLASGTKYFDGTVRIVSRLYDALEPEQKTFVQAIARYVNQMKQTDKSWASIIGTDPQKNEIVSLMNEMFQDTSRSEYLNAMFRAAGLSGGEKNPKKVAELFERITYFAGLTTRPPKFRPEGAKGSAYITEVGADLATMFMDEIKKEYKPAQGLHLGVVVAGHGAAERSRNVLIGLGVVLDKETGEGYRRWLYGLSVKTDGADAADKYHKFVEASSRLGVDIRPQEEFLAEGLYVPKEVRERIGDALARANLPPKKEGYGIIASADDNLEGLVRLVYTYMKTRMTRGAFMIRQRYFMMNTIDHFTQLAVTIGFGPALVSTTRMMLQNMVVLPGAARSVYLAQRTPGVKAVVGAQAIETWRKALQRGGDKSAQFVGELFNLSKYRIDVNDVMDGRVKPILVGKKLYSPRDIRRVAAEEGIFASFDTRALERNIRAERVATFEELHKASGRTKPQQMLDFADDLLKMTSDTAEAWSERERLGAMITLMEMGYDPRTAARITIDALYDYAGSMSKGDRKWLLNMVLPFWAFQKNANRQVFDAMFSPWGAYRMGVIRRAQEHGADIVSYLMYESIVDPYGVDVESLPEEVAQQYWTFRNIIEWGYGKEKTWTDDQRQVLEAEFGPLDQLDPASKEFLENGYGGPANIPVGVRRAMNMVFRDKSVVVEDGKVYELNYILREAKRVAALGTAPYVVPRVSRSGLPGWQRDQPMIAVSERMNTNVRTWWESASQVNPDIPVMMMFIPDSTINAGMRHLSTVLAAYVLLPTTLFSGLSDEHTLKPAFKNIVEEVFPYDRAPLLVPLAAEVGLAPKQSEQRGVKIAPEITSAGRGIKKVMGAMPIHPAIVEPLVDLIGAKIAALPATIDPYRKEFYQNEGYTEEEAKKLAELIPERHYLPPGWASLAFENVPFLGELNKFLFDLTLRPMERLGTRSKIVYAARNVLGIQTAEYRPSRVAAWEETKREMQTPTPPR